MRGKQQETQKVECLFGIGYWLDFLALCKRLLQLLLNQHIYIICPVLLKVITFRNRSVVFLPEFSLV